MAFVALLLVSIVIAKTLSENKLKETEKYNLFEKSVEDSAASPSSNVGIRVTGNDTELIGGIEEVDTTKQNSDMALSHQFLGNLTGGLELRLQAITDGTTVSVKNHEVFGDYPLTHEFVIHKISD